MKRKREKREREKVKIKHNVREQHPKSHLNKPEAQLCPFRADCTYRNEAMQMHREGKEKKAE
jgi:hypothetical protein